MRTVYAVVMILLSSSMSYATCNEAAIVAALPDEASECRYLNLLKQRFDGDRADVWEDHLSDAMFVVRAKHDHMPKCFEGLGRKLDLLR